MNRRDLLVTAILTLACLVGIVSSVPFLRVPAGIVLSLIVPGYALSEALFSATRRALAERILAVVGLSLVASIVGGLLLNILPSGVHAASWAVFLTIVTVGACGMAVTRRVADAAGDTPVDEACRPAGGWTIAGVLVALGLGLLAIVLAVISSVQQTNTLMPLALSIHEQVVHRRPYVHVSLMNSGSPRSSLVVVVREDHKTVKRVLIGSLRAGARWSIDVPVVSPRVHTCSAYLYDTGQSQPLRHVFLAVRSSAT